MDIVAQPDSNQILPQKLPSGASSTRDMIESLLPTSEIKVPTASLPEFRAFATRTVKYLFTPRTAPSLSSQPKRLINLQWIDWLILILYTAVLAYAIPHHLASDDEAQAWLLARDNGFHDIFFVRMHYEGGPALWPMLLRIAFLLHVPFQTISWIGATFAIAGIAVWLAASPLPCIFRWLLPFTFFLQYQYAVIARPYALFPFFLFLLCILFTQARPRPVLFALTAGILINISLHAALLGCFFSVLYWLRLRSMPGQTRPTKPRLAAAVVLLICCGLFSALSAFPAPDVCTDGFIGDTTGTTHPFIRSFLPVNRLPPGSPPLDPFIRPDLVKNGAPEPTVMPNPILLLVAKSIVFGADAAFFPLSASNLLALALLIAVWCWFRSLGSLELLLPYVLTIILAVQIAVFDHHTGLFVLALFAAVWIALETTPPPNPNVRPNRWSAPLLSALSLIVMVNQIGWSFHTIRSEAHHPYDPGLATSDYIKQHLAGKRIVGIGYATVTTQAYFLQSVFINQPHAYWVWSAPIFINRRRTEALNKHPDAVIIEDYVSRSGFFYNQVAIVKSDGAHAFALQRRFWEQHGYHVTQTFCGDRLFRDSSTHSACELVLLPN
jgi:hypothetical protein